VPTVLVTPMPSVALNVGANRITTGTAITHPLGAPDLAADDERHHRRAIVEQALELLARQVEGQVVQAAS
jgi:glycine/betaine/sarcosine/D-proline reductase family selenoprotein B